MGTSLALGLASGIASGLVCFGPGRVDCGIGCGFRLSLFSVFCSHLGMAAAHHQSEFPIWKVTFEVWCFRAHRQPEYPIWKGTLKGACFARN